MLNRRQFLHSSSVAASAAAVGAVVRTGLAIEPVVRNGKPKFKFSLAAYSYRELLQGSRARRRS